MKSELKEKTARGLLWGGLGNGLQQLLSLAFGIFLARRLSLHDYGMVGMLTIFTVLAGAIQECGFTNALTNRRDATHRDYNAVFWFSTFMGLTLYALLFFSIPYILRFYHKPELEAELVRLARFLFLGFVFSSTITAHNAILFKTLRVKEKTMAQVTALVLSGTIGLALAYNGMGYWSIAIQNVSYVAVFTLMLWHFSPWRPTLPPLSFSFSRFHSFFAPVRQMFGFSSKILVTNIVLQVNNNIFSMLLGRWFTTHTVGAYTQANKWNSMGYSLIGNTVNGVAQPVLTSVGDDLVRLRQVFRKMLRFTVFLSFPLMTGLGLVAHELIVITVTEKWLPAVPILQVLCLFGAFFPVTTLFTNLIISRGASNIYMYSTVALGLLQIAVLTATHGLGLRPMLMAFVALYLLWQLVWQYWAWRLIGLKPYHVWRDMLPFAAITAVAIGAAWWLSRDIANVWLSIAVKILCAAAVYIAVMQLTGAKIFRESLDYLLKKRGS